MTSPTYDPSESSGTYSGIISNYLSQWGLSDLTSTVTQWGMTGASADQINLQLQQTPEYKQRFSGNAARIASGLAPLDPASYIALEGQYKATLQQYGIPSGFYDSQQELATFIGGDVSADEFSSRVQTASDVYQNADAGTKAAWEQYYGPGDAIAQILDPTVAAPLIEQKATAAQIGGAAINQGLNAPTAAKALQYAQQGVTIDSARTAYQQVAAKAQGDQAQSARFGPMSAVNQGTEEDSLLGGDAAATQKVNLLQSEEGSMFSGHGGAAASANDAGNNY